ncbi:hypothetical protein B0I35DRAFT_418050 [Stachybotrys elegans]|uniref:DNA repair protein REV1 n=1 Tax=Stachybotrys elegans TaxID=80388 RepID=A0A8K0WWH9_9HYPO|nr:hypothetical protein B0I35DRAFT_418050 [Stachybotrys elegans]
MGTVLDKNSSAVKKRIEKHSFEDEEGEEYEASEFNGFGDYFRRKKIKLQNLDSQIRASSTKPQIFKGVVAHVTGYTQPPLHILHKEIVQHGGGFLQYLDSKTMATHIIASTLPPKKSVDFSRYRIVKPAWITESISAGKLLPWANYRVIDEGPGQKTLKFDGGKMLTQVNPQAIGGYKQHTQDSFYSNQIKNASLPSQSLSQFAEKAQTPSDLSRNGTDISSTATPRKKEYEDAGSSRPVFVTPTKRFIPGRETPSESAHGEEALEETRHAGGDSPVHALPSKEATNALTSEEHNARLLLDPRLRKSSTANPDFLKQFYSESRLHHLSTWKAELKSKMQRLAAEKSLSNKITKRKPGTRKYILHVDFDSFFCSVSLKKHPEYIDKPAVVAHSGGSGSEIASCNYPARKFGVKNGMWMKRAQEICPDIKVLPYDFPAYEEASQQFYEAIIDLGGTVQSVSVDEALVDATSLVLSGASSQGTSVDEGSIWREQEKVEEIARDLRARIKERTGCAVSVGIGGNILQAKVALRRAKPAGQYLLKPDDILDVMGELKVEELPGVSHNIGGKLEEMGIKLVKDIRNVSKERLTQGLGPKTGQRLHEYARGIDRTEVGEQPPRKSVSADINWGIRFINQQEAEEFVCNLCKELERRLVAEHVRGKQLTMKIMRRSADAPLDPPKHLGHGKCDVFNKSVVFGVATHSAETISKEANSILRSFRFSPGDLRGLGVQMTKLEPLKVHSGAPEGSQPKLNFGSFSRSAVSRKPSRTEPIDELEISHNSTSLIEQKPESDPITDDFLTTPKNRLHKAMSLAKAGEKDSKATTPLNVSGTQFIMPSNPDPAILAELPQDIRSKLMGQGTKSLGSGRQSPASRSRSGSPMPKRYLPSQVDEEVFNALPDDMKAEVLAMYGSKPPPPHASPRKDPTASPRRQPATPTKRREHQSILGNEQRHKDSLAGLVQTSFTAPHDPEQGPMDDVDELDPDFLSELPEDVRRELVADYRRRRLAQQSGLDAQAGRFYSPDPEFLLPGGQTKIQFQKLPPKVSFSGADVMSTSQIKDMLDAWHSQTREEGPHERDINVFKKYIVRVVQEERDMAKASKLVKWLDIVVHQEGEEGGKAQGKRVWEVALNGVKDAVQNAVRERGLARLNI